MDVALVRAANPSPLTLSGTNTWIAGRDPAWVVDPGPALPAHVAAVAAAVAAAGGPGGIVLTHDHPDHAEATAVLRERLGGPPVAAMRHPADIRLADGDEIGPFTALHLPGHAPDHLVFVAGDVAFTGDAVLGEGSVFVAPDGGGLGPYLDGLRRLRALELARLCPGHGPIVEDPGARLDAQIAHRLERERRLLDALAAGARDEAALLDAAWADAPAALRPAAALTLRAHVDKLRAEGRLPAGVELP
ncbi:MAG TPA: MBL fold metallo-hydrolase, partial [Solirubrobacteraceae bacterium]|nr:MBL fold metallo-hydrolase [Solirubrobacteraceae bacterium]